MRSTRVAALAMVVSLVLVGACGGSEPSLTEYVEEVNGIVANAQNQYEELLETPESGVFLAEGQELLDFTPRDLQVVLERIAVLAADVLESARAIEPPELIAELHDTWFEVDDDSFTQAQAALAARAGTAADWYELSDSPEMAAYRAALAADKVACIEFQATLDATEERGTFAETPWLPGELREVVDVLLGCEGYPEDPEAVYRPPAPDGP